MQTDTLTQKEEKILFKIRSLSSDRIVEIEDFIDFIQHKEEEHSLTQMAAKASEKSFSKVWNNPEDSVYDAI